MSLFLWKSTIEIAVNFYGGCTEKDVKPRWLQTFNANWSLSYLMRQLRQKVLHTCPQSQSERVYGGVLYIRARGRQRDPLRFSQTGIKIYDGRCRSTNLSASTGGWDNSWQLSVVEKGCVALSERRRNFQSCLCDFKPFHSLDKYTLEFHMALPS